jgi:hypothetical protein
MLINTLIGGKIICFLFGGVKWNSYLCITELVIKPTGGGPDGGRVDSTALYIFYINPPFTENMIIEYTWF